MNCQDNLFRWIISQSGSTGLALFAIGSLCAFQGFRFFRPLLVLSCGGLGWLLGILLASLTSLEPQLLGIGCMGMAALIAALWPRPAVLLACAATWAALGGYLADQMGFRPLIVSVLASISGLLGMLFAWLCFRTMTVVLTAMQGATLMMLGFVGLTSAFFPALGFTFRDWAGDQAWVVPILLTMVFVAAYSVQAAQRQGDIITGA